MRSAVKVVPDGHNFRRHGERNKEIIRKSLAECGAGRSILIDADGGIIAGNGVFEQASGMSLPVRVIETDGTEIVAVKRTDLKGGDEKRKKLALYDNASGDRVEWDFGALAMEFTEAQLLEVDVAPQDKFSAITRREEGDFDEGKVQYPITIVASRQEFDLWQRIKKRQKTNSDLAAFTAVITEYENGNRKNNYEN
jgi:hypothetical protein